MRHPFRHRLGLTLALLLVLGAAMTPGAALGQAATPTPANSSTYVVKAGDTWTRVSQITGVPIDTLKENNPKAAGHPRGWLIVGEQLFIPVGAAARAASPTVPVALGDQKGVWYQVRRGDTWAALSAATGVGIERLWAANAARLDANRGLYAEQWILIPTGDAVAPAASATPTAATTVTPVVAPTMPPTADAALTDTATSAAAIVALEQVAAAAATVSAAVQAAATVSSAVEAAATVVAAVNTISTAAAAAQAAATSIASINLNAISVPAVVTAVPTATLTPVPTTAISTQTRSASTATTATPTRWSTVATSTPAPTLAPTRGASAAGVSNCLSDKVLAANAVFDRWSQDGFTPAIEAYQAVLADTTSTTCGKVTGELDLLRDFARYRLLIASIAGGQARQVQTLGGQIKNAALKSTADAFQSSLKSSGSIVQACRDANSFAQSKPEVWRSLAELGIRLKPAEICPLG